MNRALLIVVSLLAVLALAVSGCSADEPSVQGGAQRVEVSANGAFVPNPVVVKAGMPVELELGQGSGCSAGLAIPSLGVGLTDLTQGGASISLPALQPGRHPLICQANMVMGELVVE